MDLAIFGPGGKFVENGLKIELFAGIIFFWETGSLFYPDDTTICNFFKQVSELVRKRYNEESFIKRSVMKNSFK